MEPQTLTRTAPARTGVQTALVVFNERAGGVKPSDRDALVQHLRAAGVKRYVMVGADKLSRKLFRRARGFDAVIVLGGDGTARAAASWSLPDGPPLILLPGGTLNILPKVLYGELPWPEALAAALERGVERKLYAGRANGERFFIAAMFGAPTVLARVREAVRQGRFIKAFGRMRYFFKRAFVRGLRTRHARTSVRKTEAVGVLLPPFSGKLDGQAFEWVHLNATHFVDLARVSVRALGPGWRDDPTVDVKVCEGGEISGSTVIPATLDGEPRTFFARVRVSYDPQGVRVLALED